MADDDNAGLAKRKIFPRNLTARAETVVKGNPANARPESGVDNTHPGLEFDQRNLDKAFFPGLVFEFQFLHGARLVEVNAKLFTQPTGLLQSDADGGEIYLYYVFGAFGGQPDRPRLVELHRTDGRSDGYEVLRTVHDLEPGRIMVVIGTKDPSQLQQLGPKGLEILAALMAPDEYVGKPEVPPPAPRIYRKDDKLLAAILVGDRADYLDAGVIDLSIAPAGGLTRTLCAPWQWDFADCGCHYWAANKPDIVFDKDGKAQTLNFQRSRAGMFSWTGQAPPPGKPATTYTEWNEGIMTQPSMILDWEKLPFVIAERETERTGHRPRTRGDWDKERIIEELKYLATIEHALCVEYLYAFYSLNAPAQRPDDGDPFTLDVFTAAQVVRAIAVDEMRHFRWANEALLLLGSKICLDRATEFEERENQVQGKFELRPLTPERLKYFIEVEEPSQSSGDDPNNLVGLYTKLLNALDNKIDGIDHADRRRLSEIVKMIIDEGNEHWRRCENIQKLLAPYHPKAYLRVLGPPDPPPKDADVGHLRTLADWNYRLVLDGIRQAFEDTSPVGRAEYITEARLTMYNLDSVGQALAELQHGMPFTMPNRDFKKPVLEVLKDHEATQGALESTTMALQVLKVSQRPGVRRLALRHYSRLTRAGPGGGA